MHIFVKETGARTVPSNGSYMKILNYYTHNFSVEKEKNYDDHGW